MCFRNFSKKCNFLENYCELEARVLVPGSGHFYRFFIPFVAPNRFFQTPGSWNLCKPVIEYFGVPRKAGKWKVRTRFIKCTGTSSTHLAKNANVKAVQYRNNSATYKNFLIDRWVILCTRTKKVVCYSKILFTSLLLKHIPHVWNKERLNQVTHLLQSSTSFCLRVGNWGKVMIYLLVFNVVYYSAFDARTARCQSNYAIV